jgi:hypothetical protein
LSKVSVRRRWVKLDPQPSALRIEEVYPDSASTWNSKGFQYPEVASSLPGVKEPSKCTQTGISEWGERGREEK